MADVLFDYSCGYSNRGRHWLDSLEGAELVWRPFSLLEQNAGDGGPSVFDGDEYVDNPSLIALAVHEQVRAQDADVDAYRQRMFTAWHEEPGRLSTHDIVGFGREAGLRDFDRAAGFASVASEHAAAASLGVFGTPRLVLGRGQVVFIKLDAVPDSGRAHRLWDSVDELAAAGQDLREWQRVTPPGQAV